MYKQRTSLCLPMVAFAVMLLHQRSDLCMVEEVPQVKQEMLAAKAKLKAELKAKRKSYRKGSGTQPTSLAMSSNALNVTQAEQRRRLRNRKRNCHLWAKRKAANEPPIAEAEMSTEAQLAAVPSPKRPAQQTRRVGSKRIQVESANTERRSNRTIVTYALLSGCNSCEEEEEYISKLMVQTSGVCLRPQQKGYQQLIRWMFWVGMKFSSFFNSEQPL